MGADPKLIAARLGSLGLRRFLADIWPWLGGSCEWHSTTERYHGDSTN
jgi:2-methylisoborneol synthase